MSEKADRCWRRRASTGEGGSVPENEGQYWRRRVSAGEGGLVSEKEVSAGE